MVWIRITRPENAQGSLATSYRKLGAPPARLDQIILAHSERPHTLDGHMALYRAVLHHSVNTLEKAFAEAIGALVSHINGCQYCVSHHARGLTRALGDEARAGQWLEALKSGQLTGAFDPAQVLALEYVNRLTRTPSDLTSDEIEQLRAAGWDDGQILEINQVAAYFAYANRTVLGLGVTTDKE